MKKKEKRSKKLVSSKIEITTPLTSNKPIQEIARVDAKSLSMQQYHSSIKDASKKIVVFSTELFKENLLSVKMALMEAVREVERRMRERKE